jgi:hypothetical protein
MRFLPMPEGRGFRANHMVNSHFFFGMLFFGILLGMFLGGFNWKDIRGGNREQRVVITRMVVFAAVGAIVFGAIGFFVHSL